MGSSSSSYKLAVIIKNALNDDEFVVVKQTPPPKYGDQEYDSLFDSDLWDLPSTLLNHITHSVSQSAVIDQNPDDFGSVNLDFTKFDFDFALSQVSEQVGLIELEAIKWKLMKFVEEPDFGPGFPMHTVFIVGMLRREDEISTDLCKWMCPQSCLKCLCEVKPGSDRIGPLVVLGPLKDSLNSENSCIPHTLRSQEYPPGIKIVPMGSRTAKPFRTTNLIVFVPEITQDNYVSDSFVAHGDALIVDPGCRSEFHQELKEIVAALPRKLLVFVTHHHNDHVDGLSVVQKINPDASLLAHENTMCRIKKDGWSLGYTSVSGAEEVCVGGQRLRVIFAPGHTDGHMALLHVGTRSLIVGDHCVGQGSALLDINAGGNMHEYFKTTYKFMELSPHTLIPMHGRVNLWPKHLLCGYLKNRRAREFSILKSIEDGAETLFDIVSCTYSGVDVSLWIFASSNVRLHVDHLAQQDKLPKEFSLQKFQKTCGLHFKLRWTWAYLSNRVVTKYSKLGGAKFIGVVAVTGFALIYSGRCKA